MSYINDRQKIYGKAITYTNYISNFTKIRTAILGSTTGLHNPHLHKLVLGDDQKKIIPLLRNLQASSYQKLNPFRT